MQTMETGQFYATTEASIERVTLHPVPLSVLAIIPGVPVKIGTGSTHVTCKCFYNCYLILRFDFLQLFQNPPKCITADAGGVS